jgi:outer membrane protein TolC
VNPRPRGGDIDAKEQTTVARKTNIPADQLQRLRQRYAEERTALVALAAAESVVLDAETKLATAEQALTDARADAESAFQQLVEMVGSATAKDLTGRSATARRASSPHRQKESDPADAGAHVSEAVAA